MSLKDSNKRQGMISMPSVDGSLQKKDKGKSVPLVKGASQSGVIKIDKMSISEPTPNQGNPFNLKLNCTRSSR